MAQITQKTPLDFISLGEGENQTGISPMIIMAMESEAPVVTHCANLSATQYNVGVMNRPQSRILRLYILRSRLLESRGHHTAHDT